MKSPDARLRPARGTAAPAHGTGPHPGGLAWDEPDGGLGNEPPAEGLTETEGGGEGNEPRRKTWPIPRRRRGLGRATGGGRPGWRLRFESTAVSDTGRKLTDGDGSAGRQVGLCRGADTSLPGR
jgi:hypothetical protein